MRHRKKGRKLGLTTNHYHLMSRQIVNDLFKHERIVTTSGRAKEFRKLAEKLITRAKKLSLANYRIILSALQNKVITQKLFKEIAPRFQDRNGGYTRILHLGASRWSGEKKAGKWAMTRLGDCGERVILELVSKAAPKEKDKAKKDKVKAKAPKA
jgi:large subunit ribosomal protein L17